MGQSQTRAESLRRGDVLEESSSSPLAHHVGQKSQLKRFARILRSKLQALEAQGDRAELAECSRLAEQIEELLEPRRRRESKEVTVPQEVREWLKMQWTEGSFRLGEDLSPIRGGATLQAARSPFGQELAAILQHVGTPDVDVVAVQRQPEVAGNVLTVLFMYTLSYGGVFDQLPVQSLQEADGALFQDRLVNFVAAVDKAYLDVPYHNNMHAADVTMMMHSFILTENMSWVSPIEHLMGLLAAVIHDVGHDGVNNLFHTKAQTLLAIRYNDKSPLENMHCALAFELMKDQDMDWLSLLNRAYTVDPSQKATDLRQYLRRSIIETVLSTDPVKHNQLMDDLKGLVSAGITDAKQKQDAFSILLHSADVSNATRTLPIALYWSRQVLQEFWAQGDQERSLQLDISPMCDRSGMEAVPQSQIGFISFIVKPLYQQLSLLLPEVGKAVEQLHENEAYWQQKKEEGASFEASFALLDQ